MFSDVPTSEKYFLIASEYTIYCSYFQLFLIFFFQKHRSKCARMHILVSLVSKLSQQCQLWFIAQCFRWWADILPSINIDYTCNLLSLLIVDHIDRSVTQTRWMFALLNMFNFQNTSRTHPPERSPWKVLKNENIVAQKFFFLKPFYQLVFWMPVHN